MKSKYVNFFSTYIVKMKFLQQPLEKQLFTYGCGRSCFMAVYL